MGKRRRLDLGIEPYKYIITETPYVKHIVQDCVQGFFASDNYANKALDRRDVYTTVCDRQFRIQTSMHSDTGIDKEFSLYDDPKNFYGNRDHERCDVCYENYCVYPGKYVDDLCNSKAGKRSDLCNRHLKSVVRKIDQKCLPFDVGVIIVNYLYS